MRKAACKFGAVCLSAIMIFSFAGCGSSSKSSSSSSTSSSSKSTSSSYSASSSTASGDYVLNTNSHKFHHTWCKSVKKMSDANKAYSSDSRDEIISQGYEPCKNCNP